MPPGRWWSRALLAVLVLLLLGATLQGEAAGADLEEARQLRVEGRTQEALRRVERMLAADPGDLEGRMMKGVLLADLGRSAEAEQIFVDLIQQLPDAPEPYNNLAALYTAAGEYEKAIEVLKRALRTHPSYQTAYENLSRLYGKLAGQAYERALGEDSFGEEETVQLTYLPELSRVGFEVREPVEEEVVAADREPLTVSPPPAVVNRKEESESGEIAAAERAESVTAGDSQQAPAQAESPAIEATANTSEPDLSRLWPRVEAWAAAWAEQRADDYLQAYSAGFKPPRGMSRRQWESLRRERLTAPRFIEVSLAFLDSGQTGPGQAQARFIQSYRSDRFADVVTKTLEMVWENDHWRIRNEIVEAASQ